MACGWQLVHAPVVISTELANENQGLLWLQIRYADQAEKKLASAYEILNIIHVLECIFKAWFWNEHTKSNTNCEGIMLGNYYC